MSDLPFPYSLPIWRGSHSAPSPDGKLVAEISETREISMGNPTVGTLRISTGLELERCNPSFIWSDDSRYVAVPQYIVWFLLFRRQRIVVVDVRDGLAYGSPETTHYFQPESFERGRLVVKNNPHRGSEVTTWRVPGDLARFVRVSL